MEIIYKTIGIGILVLTLGLYTGILSGITLGNLRNQKNEV